MAAIGFVVGTLAFSSLLRPYQPSPQKGVTYECGELPRGKAWIRFNFRFYVYALLFVVFDVETLFLFPWAVRYKQFIAEGLGMQVFFEMALFIAILLLALLYSWRKKALRWF